VTDLFRLQSSLPETVAAFTPKVVPNSGAELRQERERLSITFIGHATLLVQGAGVAILTDPMFSRRVGGLFGRFAPPGVALKDLPPIDVVVISHNHRDHLDEASVLALGKAVLYVVPLGLAPWFRARGLLRVVELDWWQSIPVTTAAGRTATVTLVPAQHWSWRGPLDERKSLWGGYVLDFADSRIYFAGDTGYPAAFQEIGRRFPGIDYALLPIGAYGPRWFMKPQHMAPEEAARAFVELGARALVPMHYATFRLADEPMDEPPRLLRKALARERISEDRLRELAIGQTCWGKP
jgi:L-ascorbate metabolism protein UlaG (beta-lactamase superfamily)